MTSSHLVAGLGQIGTAVRSILGADGLDSVRGVEPSAESYEALHICFPFSENFASEVHRYRERFKPAITVVHSTVPVGTCEPLHAVHSPCRGIHPHLEEGLRTFVKYFGGPEADTAATYFTQVGITTRTTPLAKSTEALKVWDTTIYGWNIVLGKVIHDYCERNGLDFDLVYTDANRSYNEGYEKLGHPEYKKYVLKHVPGPIGGHCVVPNLDLFESEAADLIKEFNRKLAQGADRVQEVAKIP